MNHLTKIIILVGIGLVFQSCSSIKTNDSNDSYYYWAGQKPPKEVKVINGKYWRSAHFTLEYIFFLEANVSKDWIEDYIEINDLVIDSSEFNLPNNKPNWFQPNKDYLQYKLNTDFDQGSRYFIDSLNSKIYIYEIQL